MVDSRCERTLYDVHSTSGEFSPLLGVSTAELPGTLDHVPFETPLEPVSRHHEGKA